MANKGFFKKEAELLFMVPIIGFILLLILGYFIFDIIKFVETINMERLIILLIVVYIGFITIGLFTEIAKNSLSSLKQNYKKILIKMSIYYFTLIVATSVLIFIWHKNQK